jgi:hypothetical protein
MNLFKESNRDHGNAFTKNVAHYLAQQGVNLQPEYSM